MKRAFVMAFSSLILTFQPAQAGLFERQWIDDEISNIINDVLDTKNEVLTGRLAIVKNELHRQLLERNTKAGFLNDSVEDLFNWLQQRRVPYTNFVNAPLGGERCGPGSTCNIFRDDLITLVTDLAALRENFPVIEELGLGDGSRAVQAIEIAPPVVLFALHETMGRMDQWRTIPADLQELFDEIGDPEAFSGFLEPFSEGSTLSVVESQNATFAVFEKTPTQRFCDRHETRLGREIDPVRLNRLQLFVYFLRSGFGLVESLVAETVGGEAAGFGSDTVIPNPLKAQIKVMLLVFDVTQRAVQTFRANLEICRDQRRELEFQVARCIELVDFVMPSKRDEVYELVADIVDRAEEEGVSVSNARKSLEKAEMHRLNMRWKEAYVSLCDAYQKIGA